jgi:hypothetical protein
MTSTCELKIWRAISLVLTVALIAVLIELQRSSTTRLMATVTLPTLNSPTDLERLALSPNARRVHERYSL